MNIASSEEIIDNERLRIKNTESQRIAVTMVLGERIKNIGFAD